MKVVKGDLIQLIKKGHFDVVVHGCNCFHTMGAGVAEQLREAFPWIYDIDRKTAYGDVNKLGTYSKTRVLIPTEPGSVTILNGYTQFRIGRDKSGTPPLNYEAVDALFGRVAVDFRGLRIGYPRIGAGLGGGNWQRIAEIIDDRLRDEDHTLVEYSP